MSTIKEQVTIGNTKWKQGVDPTDTASADEYIKFKLIEYKYFERIKDDDLWEQFKDDFTGFTKETLEACHRALIRDLRDLLRNHGV